MPQITLDTSDATELAELLTFLTGWLSGSQKQALADSFAAFVGHPAYDTGTLHRPAPVRLPPRRQRRRRTLRRADPMTGRMHHPLDKITRITNLSAGPLLGLETGSRCYRARRTRRRDTVRSTASSPEEEGQAIPARTGRSLQVRRSTGFASIRSAGVSGSPAREAST